VIKSCLLTLSRLGGYEFIHNVTFLAGATHFTKDHDLWRLIFSRVVNGKISNVFSKGDSILKLYKFAKKKKPIGRSPIFVEDPMNTKSTKYELGGEFSFSLKNYELPMQPGHFKYKERMNEIVSHFKIE
jgi:hypothetical protein